MSALWASDPPRFRKNVWRVNLWVATATLSQYPVMCGDTRDPRPEEPRCNLPAARSAAEELGTRLGGLTTPVEAAPMERFPCTRFV